MAPADHADALGIQKAIGVKHPLRAVENVVDLAASVINLFVEAATIAGAAPVIAGDDGVTLLQQFPDHMQIAGIEVSVNALMSEGEKRLFFRAVQVFRDKGVGVNNQRIGGSGSFRIGRVRGRGTGVLNNIHVRDIGEAGEPEKIFYPFQNLIRTLRRGGLWRQRRRRRRGLLREQTGGEATS